MVFSPCCSTKASSYSGIRSLSKASANSDFPEKLTEFSTFALPKAVFACATVDGGVASIAASFLQATVNEIKQMISHAGRLASFGLVMVLRTTFVFSMMCTIDRIQIYAPSVENLLTKGKKSNGSAYSAEGRRRDAEKRRNMPQRYAIYDMGPVSQ